MNKNMPDMAAKIWAVIKKNKFVMVVLVIGLVLILLPTGSRSDETESDCRGNLGCIVFSQRAGGADSIGTLPD